MSVQQEQEITQRRENWRNIASQCIKSFLEELSKGGSDIDCIIEKYLEDFRLIYVCSAIRPDGKECCVGLFALSPEEMEGYGLNWRKSPFLCDKEDRGRYQNFAQVVAASPDSDMFEMYLEDISFLSVWRFCPVVLDEPAGDFEYKSAWV